ncbi:MAG TPA: DUF3524 domain-containing protein [Planctomycetes bacterium]|nr:DUF3524 domain-containing protein [Planctomycetota bacterium]HIL53163.1 DUF3524 domain-containing protein [Planctomycetota bacterium]
MVPMLETLDILALEPWFGGSHRAFLEAWQARSQHSLEFRGLPDKQWKWRMRAGAWELARGLDRDQTPDLLFASDYLDLPSFLGHAPPRFAELPRVVYFHENQLTYPLSPGRQELERDSHYGFTNIQSCLVADGLVFNSAFHLEDFSQAAFEFLRHLPRPSPRAELERALQRAQVIAPGIELENFALGSGAPPEAPLRVLYNHRFEHDKDPLSFLRALIAVREGGARFELVLLGESFKSRPEGCAECLETLEPTILRRGFAASRSEYVRLLESADVVVSTARHEFFGISVLEAMAAGATPLLPDRLSYPELVGPEASHEALYADEADLCARLRRLAAAPELARQPAQRGRWRILASRWSARATASELDRFCLDISERKNSRMAP